MKKLSLLVTGAALAAFSLGFPGAASAAPGVKAHPTGCEYKTNYENGAKARCSKSNGGHYRASALCERWDGGGLVDTEAIAWRTSGWSNVYCPPQTRFHSAGIVTKST